MQIVNEVVFEQSEIENLKSMTKTSLELVAKLLSMHSHGYTGMYLSAVLVNLKDVLNILEGNK